MKRFFNFVEYLFAIISLILYTGGVLAVILSGGFSEGSYIEGIDENAATDPANFAILRIIYQVTYLIAFLLLTRKIISTGKVSDILFRNPYILAIIGLALISVTWSVLPEVSINRAAAIIGTTIFAIYLANRYTLKEQIVLLGHTFLVIIFLSFVFAIALPQYGIMSALHAGAWRGIYTHKNGLGKMMVLSTLVFAIQPREWSQNQTPDLKSILMRLRHNNSIGKFKEELIKSSQKNSFIASFIQSLLVYLGLSLSILLVLLSRSSTSLVNTILLLTLLAVLKITKLRSHQRFFAILATIVVLCIVAVMVIPDPEVIFASLGKSSDLTGRSDLWDLLLDMISQRPLLGYGYGAFWEQYQKVLAPYNRGWAAPNAHNGFLDLTLALGLLGLALFTISSLNILSKSFTHFRSGQANTQLWPLVALTYIFLANLGETDLVEQNSIIWILYVIVGYSVVARSQKPILALPESRVKKPILALPEARRREQKYLSESRRKKNFLALPEARTTDSKAMPRMHRKM